MFSMAASSGNVCQDVAEPININVGDVVSAELLTEIVTRLNESQLGMKTSDLLGTWTCTSNIRPSMSCGSYSVSGTAVEGPHNGYSFVDGRYTVTQDVVVTEHDNDEVLLKYPSNMGQCFAPTGVQQQCVAQIIDGQRIFNRALTGIDTGYGTGCNVDLTSSDCCFNTGSYEINRRGKHCFTMENINETSISCVKKDRPPLAVTSLSSAVNSNNIALSWTAPSDATSHEVHRKTTATGTFASIGNATSNSYEDSQVTSGSTYWYRVFAKNTNGTSTGSSIVKVTYNPSATLSSTSINIIDYLDGLSANESEHTVSYSTKNNVMKANLEVGQLDAENLNGLIAGTGGKSPVIKFELASVPSAGMSGTVTLNSKILDGTNTTRENGERSISATVTINWSSDGEKLALSIPNQNVTVTLVGNKGTGIQGNWPVGGSTDVMNVSASGINKPQTLDVKLLEFLSSNIAANGPSLSNFFVQGSYAFQITIEGINLTDASGENFTEVTGNFGIDSNPESVAYVKNVIVTEGSDLATILVKLSSPADKAVTLDYLTSENTAVSGSDFTAVSGSLRIAAGNLQGAFTVPLTDDSAIEEQEDFNISLSNIENALLSKRTAKITIIDNDSAS